MTLKAIGRFKPAVHVLENLLSTTASAMGLKYHHLSTTHQYLLRGTSAMSSVSKNHSQIIIIIKKASWRFVNDVSRTAKEAGTLKQRAHGQVFQTQRRAAGIGESSD